MKKLLIVSACIAALGAGMAFAQGGDGAHYGKQGERPSKEERMERMREHLELTDAQVEEIRAIREAGGGREEVRAVLTDEQREKADAARERHRQRKGERPPRPEPEE